MKIAWLIDIQAPYREPMYAALAGRADFACYFFFREEPIRHFAWRPHPDYRSEVVGSIRLPVPARIARLLDGDRAVLAPGAARRILDGADVLGLPGWDQPVYLGMAVRALRRGIPYVMYYESTLRSRRFDRGPVAAVRSWMFRNAGAVVVPGPAARDAAVASGAHPTRVVESVNSIDLATFADGPRRLRAMQEAQDTEDAAGPHRFAYVGQLIPRKNVGALLEAFAALEHDAVLEIAGDGAEGVALATRARELGIADRVRFPGFLDEEAVVGLLARTRTLVLPSVEEVYGMTALEAHVAGCQVVVSRAAGVADTLEASRGTWVVEPTVDDLHKGLDAAVRGWSGWSAAPDDGVASPGRTADDVVRAAEIALARR